MWTMLTLVTPAITTDVAYLLGRLAVPARCLLPSSVPGTSVPSGGAHPLEMYKVLWMNGLHTGLFAVRDIFSRFIVVTFLWPMGFPMSHSKYIEHYFLLMTSLYIKKSIYRIIRDCNRNKRIDCYITIFRGED